MAKGKAVMATGVNMKLVSKIPGYIKEVLNNLKSDLEEMKQAIMDLKV
jgi:hypothetical protein